MIFPSTSSCHKTLAKGTPLPFPSQSPLLSVASVCLTCWKFVFSFYLKRQKEWGKLRNLFHLLVYSPNAYNVQGWAKLNQEPSTPSKSWQEPKQLSRHLLPPEMHMSKKQDSEAELGLEPGIPQQGGRHLEQWLNDCATCQCPRQPLRTCTTWTSFLSYVWTHILMCVHVCVFRLTSFIPQDLCTHIHMYAHVLFLVAISLYKYSHSAPELQLSCFPSCKYLLWPFMCSSF